MTTPSQITLSSSASTAGSHAVASPRVSGPIRPQLVAAIPCRSGVVWLRYTGRSGPERTTKHLEVQ